MTLDLELISTYSDYWSELKTWIDKDLDIDLIKKAYDLTKDAHEGLKRETGEPYISHPVWVAKVVAQLAVGQEAILAALLHDCVQDGSATINEISNEFGDEVALLVSGLTEVKKKSKGVEVHNTSIEIFRRFLFSSVNDVRIPVIRMVDKLHNGITIWALNKEGQIRYANRVLGIYSPIAEYVGLHFFKRELDDIAFRILNPNEANRVEKMFRDMAKDEIKALSLVKNVINSMLKINNIHDYEIQGRIKSLYSTYQKIKNKNELTTFDRVGVRIITTTVADCYTALGLLHSKFRYLPDEFDDYISNPKPNGYRSIQTTLLWKDNLMVEVQIRTVEMHDFDEFGPASHIAYKLSRSNKGGIGYEWIRDLVKWQKGNKNINNYQISVLSKYVYVFTPKGDTIQMPLGSTALDFAYRVHTDIGDHCVGVKINQKMAKIDSDLKTGDYIEILTSKKSNVNKNWLSFVKTQWAKEHIRKIVNSLEE
jgi:GTP diphosphokinase / guanosine-3',5'-bis(diphosphate) 3'-diphosphatase